MNWLVIIWCAVLAVTVLGLAAATYMTILGAREHRRYFGEWPWKWR